MDETEDGEASKTSSVRGGEGSDDMAGEEGSKEADSKWSVVEEAEQPCSSGRLRSGDHARAGPDERRVASPALSVPSEARPRPLKAVVM